MVRCKVRVMEVTREWRGATTIKLRPVTASKEHPENATWWDATPSGGIELRYQAGREPAELLIPGSYHYLDLTELADEADEARPWRLHTLVQTQGCLGVRLAVTWDNAHDLITGDVELDVAIATTWPRFAGKVASRWRLAFSYAGPELADD